MTDSEYLIQLANQTPYQNVAEIKEHCDRLRRIAERLRIIEDTICLPKRAGNPWETMFGELVIREWEKVYGKIALDTKIE